VNGSVTAGELENHLCYLDNGVASQNRQRDGSIVFYNDLMPRLALTARLGISPPIFPRWRPSDQKSRKLGL
jgi:hypothetical protein